MWWRQDDRPRTAEERDAEIVSLVRRRDRLLERAPRSAIAGQLMRGLTLLVILTAVAGGVVADYPSISAGVVYGIYGLLCLLVIYSSLRFPPMSDRWAMSRLVGYDGDSPQDLQDRIDALRAETVGDGLREPMRRCFSDGPFRP